MEVSEKRLESVQFCLIVALVFFQQIATGMCSLTFIYHLRRVFALSAGLIGLAAGTASLVYVFACIFLSRFYKRFKLSNQVVFGSFGLALVIFFISMSDSLLLTWILIAIFGLFHSILWPSFDIWIARGKEGIQLSKALGIFNVSGGIGASLAPFLCTLLVERNTHLSFYVAACIVLFNGILVVCLSLVIPSIGAIASEKNYIQMHQKVDHSTPLRYLAWIGVFMTFLVSFSLQTTFPLFTKEVLHWSESTTGLILLLMGISSCLTFMYLGKRTFWHFKLQFIVCIQLALILLLVSFRLVQNVFLFMIFFIGIGFFAASASLSSVFHGASGAQERSRRMNIHEVSLNLGIVLGGGLGGGLYQRVGFHQMLLWIALLLFFVLLGEVGIYLFKRKASCNRTVSS